MTNYIPHYAKKKQILFRKEEVLRRLVSSGSAREWLRRVAEEVRDARIRVLRAQRSGHYSKAVRKKSTKKIDSRIQKLEEMSADAILLEFGCTIDDNQTSE